MTGQHVALVALALATACAVAFPLGLYAARRPRVSAWMLAGLGALYTVPSLALLAVLVQTIGLGMTPLFVALVIYAQFVLARGFVSGIRGVDASQVDAARGLGMAGAQVFFWVEVPLARPTIVGGIRIAAIAMISLATLGGYVGGGGLGVLIFNGLALHQPEQIVAGSVAVCVLAVAVDASLRRVSW